MVQTVIGRIQGSEMGVVLPHEHIFIDLRRFCATPSDPDLNWILDARVGIELLGDLSHHGNACRDNLVLDDAEVASKELLLFKAAGGGTIVELTCSGISPNPLGLRALSEKTGVYIIAGCGYYVDRSHPPDMASRSVTQIAEEMIGDLTEGIGGTDVKAGIIGEVGTSQPITDNERKVLLASAHAHKVTGAAISVHFHWRGKQGPSVLKTLESAGVDPAKIILGHQDDIVNPTLEYYKSLVQRGSFIAFDGFGVETYSAELDLVHARDVERISFVDRLIDAGYVDSILLSHDVAYKTHTSAYGGPGYGHIPKRIVPMLRKLSITDSEIKRMLVENPRRAIA